MVIASQRHFMFNGRDGVDGNVSIRIDVSAAERIADDYGSGEPISETCLAVRSLSSISQA